MNRFLLLLPIWTGAIAFLIMYYRKEESVRKVLLVVSLAIIIGGVGAFAYIDMSNENANYLPASFSDISDSKIGQNIKQKQVEKQREKIETQKSEWGSNFWNDYMSKKNNK